MMKPLSTFLLFLLVVTIVPACSSDERPAVKDTVNSSAVDTANYLARGTVISIPPGNRNIVIKHGDIPGFMDAMTMPFTLKDSMLINGIAAKDSIRFKIKTTRSKIFISEIEKIE